MRDVCGHVTAAELMSEPVSCPSYADLDAVEGLMLTHDVPAVVVVDDDGVLQGIVTKTDIVRHHFSASETETEVAGDAAEQPARECPYCGQGIDEDALDQDEPGYRNAYQGASAPEADPRWGLRAERQRPAIARELMSPALATLTPKQSLHEVLATMEAEQVFCLPVVASASDKTVLGMVTRQELVDWLGRCVRAGRRLH